MDKKKIVMYRVNHGYMNGIDYHVKTVVAMETNNVSELLRLYLK